MKKLHHLLLLIFKRWYAWRRHHTWVRIAFTEGRSLYYLKHLALKRRASFEVIKRPMPLPSLAENGSIDGWFASAIHIKKDNGEEYWRKVYPFALYKLPSHRIIEWVRADDDLVLDYVMDTARYLAAIGR